MTDSFKIPEVGTPATLKGYSDRYACTVIQANSRQILVQRDKATRTDDNGISESQTYEYERNPEGEITKFTRRGNGKYVEVGHRIGTGHGLTLGERREYRDPSF